MDKELSKDAKNASSANLTAVEWLINYIGKEEGAFTKGYILRLLEQAKEMERQQKRKDFTDGYMHGDKPLNHNVINKWYNETYGGNND